jgi:hypothetical protein
MKLRIGLVTFAVALGMLAEVIGAQSTNPALPSPTAPPAKSDKAPVEHGSRPDPGAVRPGNQDGDQPSASAGDLIRDAKQRRIFGLPVNAALVVAGVIVALFVVAGVAIPAARRRDRARGNGAYR